MEMDRLTRRQADRIEYVMRDLLRDLQLIAFLPVDLYPWTRRSCLEAARNLLAEASMNQGMNGAAAQIYGEDDNSTYVAQLIYGLAERYGDATDVDNNELLLQMTEFAELEREMLDTASSVGAVDEYDINRHHKLFRAVLDTLQQEGYTELVAHSLKWGSGDDSAVAQPPGAYPMEPSVFNRLVDPGMLSLQRTVECLCELLVVRNTSTVTEDIHNYKILHEAVNKEKSSSADVKALKREYHEIREARRTEVAALQAEVRQLEDEIEYTRSVLELELSAFGEANAKLEEERQVEEEERINALKEEAEHLKQKLDGLIAANQGEAATLRTQRAKKEAAVSAAITEYDTQMATLHAASVALNKETEEDTEAIVALDGELGALCTERNEYELEKYIEEMREKHYERMHEQTTRYASTIQACFRAYLTRVNFERGLANSKRKRKRKNK
ncbi:uncharacterized protein TEOVI_000313900 [Trypanosoma equiperdum]|uniref:Dynein regulatory complex protein 10 n=1 Tax=Trypanosoma equiperdum TaxID=5694 RepID=A0A1G4IGM3_TRYEQ|nr:hypothetical protein, conserved [Trypanosoma equiperdum]